MNKGFRSRSGRRRRRGAALGIGPGVYTVTFLLYNGADVRVGTGFFGNVVDFN
ncbi:MAG: hypothetical protein NC910_04005 [Candidatus Omnitrophica bacterium]|nr:hypothetical protein [Candidatus Omnitrophota bacterium]